MYDIYKHILIYLYILSFSIFFYSFHVLWIFVRRTWGLETGSKAFNEFTQLKGPIFGGIVKSGWLFQSIWKILIKIVIFPQ